LGGLRPGKSKMWCFSPTLDERVKMQHQKHRPIQTIPYDAMLNSNAEAANISMTGHLRLVDGPKHDLCCVLRSRQLHAYDTDVPDKQKELFAFDITGGSITTFTTGPSTNTNTFQLHIRDDSKEMGSRTVAFTAPSNSDSSKWLHAIRFNIAGGEVVVVHDEFTQGRRLLLIDKQVDHKHALVFAAKHEITTVMYSSKEDTIADLIERLPKGSGDRFASIALANHGADNKTGNWVLAADLFVTVGAIVQSSVQALAPFMDALVDMLDTGGRIDLLGCSLGQSADALLVQLETKYSVNFTASSNATGNEYDGGDWVMETDDVNVAPYYFDIARLAKYDVLMDGRAEEQDRRSVSYQSSS